MKHTKEEIINALKVIKDECAEFDDDCQACPFYSYEDGCKIANIEPWKWKLAELPPPEKWRALK